MGLETIPAIDFASYSALVALLDQYEYFSSHALALIIIPSGALAILNTNKLEEYKFSIVKILSFISIGIIGGFLIPIDMGILSYIVGSGAIAEGFMGVTYLIHIIGICLLLLTLILVSIKLE